MKKKTFRQLVAELMMDVEKWGDLVVDHYMIVADYNEDTDAIWSYEVDEQVAEAYHNEDMGFDPYMGCYTDDC